MSRAIARRSGWLGDQLAVFSHPTHHAHAHAHADSVAAADTDTAANSMFVYGYGTPPPPPPPLSPKANGCRQANGCR